jgi:hypothetical protein
MRPRHAGVAEPRHVIERIRLDRLSSARLVFASRRGYRDLMALNPRLPGKRVSPDRTASHSPSLSPFRPATGKAAVIALQEWWGVDEEIKEHAKKIAAEG